MSPVLGLTRSRRPCRSAGRSSVRKHATLQLRAGRGNVAARWAPGFAQHHVPAADTGDEIEDDQAARSRGRANACHQLESLEREQLACEARAAREVLVLRGAIAPEALEKLELPELRLWLVARADQPHPVTKVASGDAGNDGRTEHYLGPCRRAGRPANPPFQADAVRHGEKRGPAPIDRAKEHVDAGQPRGEVILALQRRS